MKEQNGFQFRYAWAAGTQGMRKREDSLPAERQINKNNLLNPPKAAKKKKKPR